MSDIKVQNLFLERDYQEKLIKYFYKNGKESYIENLNQLLNDTDFKYNFDTEDNKTSKILIEFQKKNYDIFLQYFDKYELICKPKRDNEYREEYFQYIQNECDEKIKKIDLKCSYRLQIDKKLKEENEKKIKEYNKLHEQNYINFREYKTKYSIYMNKKALNIFSKRTELAKFYNMTIDDLQKLIEKIYCNDKEERTLKEIIEKKLREYDEEWINENQCPKEVKLIHFPIPDFDSNQTINIEKHFPEIYSHINESNLEPICILEKQKEKLIKERDYFNEEKYKEYIIEKYEKIICKYYTNFKINKYNTTIKGYIQLRVYYFDKYFFCITKNVLSNNYIQLLEQYNKLDKWDRNSSNYCLIINSFDSSDTSKDELVKIFGLSDFRVIFLDELNSV
jgi:hypothetical protein